MNVALFVTPPAVPETVQVVLEATADVFAVTVPLVWPDAIVIDVAESFTAALGVAVKVTVVPDGPAGEASVAVIVTLLTPPTTELVFAVTEEMLTGLIVKVAVTLTPLAVAVSVSAVAELTDEVVIENVALELPLATVTVAGTLAAVEFETESETVNPLDGAAAVRVTVPVMLLPPVTEEDETLTLFRPGPELPDSAATNPAKFMHPQPVTKSHPVPAFDV